MGTCGRPRALLGYLGASLAAWLAPRRGYLGKGPLNDTPDRGTGGESLSGAKVCNLPVSGICVADTRRLSGKMGLSGAALDRETRRQRPARADNGQSVNFPRWGWSRALCWAGEESTAPRARETTTSLPSSGGERKSARAGRLSPTPLSSGPARPAARRGTARCVRSGFVRRRPAGARLRLFRRAAPGWP